MLRLILLAWTFAMIPVVASADIVGAVNKARLHDCRADSIGGARAERGTGSVPPLRENSRLNEAARRLALGETLQNAAQRAGYRSVTSAAVQMSNVPDDHEVEKIVAQRFCAQITGRDLRDIGTYRRGADVWLMVAAPFTPPSPKDAQEVSHRVLDLTNQARAHARRCGSEYFPAAAPLVFAPTALERAAVEHSKDMASHNYMDHIGRDGSTPADRVTRTGYRWKAIGENLASGIVTPDEVVSGWVGSPHHCENLMSARFTQMSVAYAVSSSGNAGIYWTQLFGTPP